MSDDYLWDGSGPPDPDVERLEQMLGRLRTTSRPPELTVRRKPDATYISVRFLAPALAVAAAIIVMVALTWRTAGAGASWDVARISGTPRIGSGALSGAGRLAVGQTLVTDATSQARLHVSTIGEVTVDADTRV